MTLLQIEPAESLPRTLAEYRRQGVSIGLTLDADHFGDGGDFASLFDQLESASKEWWRQMNTLDGNPRLDLVYDARRQITAAVSHISELSEELAEIYAAILLDQLADFSNERGEFGAEGMWYSLRHAALSESAVRRYPYAASALGVGEPALDS